MAKHTPANLPTLPTGVKIRLSRKTGQLERVYIAPASVVEEVAPVVEPVLQSPAYAEAARELDELVYALEQEFTRLARKPAIRPTAQPVISAPSTLPQAPRVDILKGNLNGSNRGFSIFK
jgi:hypothetical protein